MLCQGQAKLSTTAKDGKAFILRIAKPGEVLGLHAVVIGKPYEVTVETMQPCLLNWVNRKVPSVPQKARRCLPVRRSAYQWR